MNKELYAEIVILLFIGLAFASPINANVTKDELVEITTEVCGIDGVKPQTIKLTKQESIEVEQLIDSIKERLDKAETREETIEIFNDAIVELDKYGLLGELSVEQTQRFVTDRYQNSRITDYFDKLCNRHQEIDNDDSNILCLIAGYTDDTAFLGPIGLIIGRLGQFLYRFEIIDTIRFYIGFNPFISGLDLIYFFSILFNNLINPLSLTDSIGFGEKFITGPDSGWRISNGWIYTIGIKGLKSWNGSFWGQHPFPIKDMIFGVMIGAVGFTGFKILIDYKYNFYLGSTLWIKIGSKGPYD